MRVHVCVYVLVRPHIKRTCDHTQASCEKKNHLCRRSASRSIDERSAQTYQVVHSICRPGSHANGGGRASATQVCVADVLTIAAPSSPVKQRPRSNKPFHADPSKWVNHAHLYIHRNGTTVMHSMSMTINGRVEGDVGRRPLAFSLLSSLPSRPISPECNESLSFSLLWNGKGARGTCRGWHLLGLILTPPLLPAGQRPQRLMTK